MTAARKMSRYSLIQLLEQVAKIALTVYLTKRSDVFQYDSIALICFAITIREMLSFSLSLIFYRLDVWRERAIRNKFPGFIKRMMRIAVPDAMGAYVRSALNTVEHLLIPKGIRRSGASTEKALSDYGVVQGMALPVLLYPSSILGVLSGLLVPEIAECKLKKNEVQSNYMINRVLHITMIFSMLVTSVMLIFANELSEQI
jgi:stage V sporulation protein B